MQNKKDTVTIVGAGLAGCFLALLLAKRGFQVEIFEQASASDLLRNTSKRSFNLTFYGYGIHALKKAGIWSKIKPLCIQLYGSETTVSYRTKPIIVNFPKTIPYFTISRQEMLRALISEVKTHTTVRFHFSKSVIAIDRYARTLQVKNTRSGKIDNRHCQVVFGADGVNSQIRSAIQQGQEAFHQQEYLDWEYKQFAISAKTAEKIGMTSKRMYSWTQKNLIITAFPYKDGSYNAMLILPRGIFDKPLTKNELQTLILSTIPVLKPAMNDLSAAIVKNQIGTFVTILTQPWFYKDFLVLIGDAAHGFLPFYGQGMSTAFADCLVLDTLISKYGTKWDIIFPSYQKLRKKHTDILADLSQESFKRYTRNSRADYSLIYERVENLLSLILPKLWRPPVFDQISHDLEHAADYFALSVKQRKHSRFIGLPLFVSAITGLVAAQEIAFMMYKKSAHVIRAKKNVQTHHQTNIPVL